MQPMPDILNKIIENKKGEVESNRMLLAPFKSACRDLDPCRPFVSNMMDKLRASRAAVIAEIKQASPSKGIIRKGYKPMLIAPQYEVAGAACISILTEQRFFHGNIDHLMSIRYRTSLPILRKDFIVDEIQLYESRACGADAILLIVAALTPTQLQQFSGLAKELGMAVLVESHTHEELGLALQLDTPLIGINNRNLHTFTTDINTSIKLAKDVPDNRIVIAESGIQTIDDVRTLQANHINSFLVGESFMRADDIPTKFAEMFH